MGNGGGWTAIDNAMIFDPSLTATEFRVLCALASYDWPDRGGARKGRVWPSMSTLAEGLGLSRRSVLAALRSLERKERIRKVRGGGGKALSNVYELTPYCANFAQYDPETAQKATPNCEENFAQIKQLKNTNREQEEERDLHPEFEERKNEKAKPDQRLCEFVQILKLRVSNGTWGAYLASMVAEPSGDGTALVITHCHPMAQARLRGAIEKAATYAGFSTVEWPDGESEAES